MAGHLLGVSLEAGPRTLFVIAVPCLVVVEYSESVELVGHTMVHLAVDKFAVVVICLLVEEG